MLRSLHKKRLELLVLIPFLPSFTLGQSEEVEDEMTVYARKRQEVQQVVPATIQVLDSESLEKQGLENISDLKLAVPNLWVLSTNGGGNHPMFMRGVGQWDFLSTTDPGVGVYVDEVYLGRTFSGFTDFLDLDRVEVHKGPGGTLFGKNTIGGALQLWTKSPGSEQHHIVESFLGSYQTRGLKVEGDFPLIPGTLLARISGGYEYNDGWLKREHRAENLGQHEKVGIRLQLTWLANEAWSHRLKMESFNKRGTSQPHSQAGFVDNPLSEAFRFLVEPCCEIPQTEERISYSKQDALDDQDVLFATIISERSSEFGNLKNIMAYGDTNVHFAMDVDGTAATFAETTNLDHHYQFSEELQWISKGQSWTFVGGIHYFREGASDESDVRLASGLYEASQGQIPVFDLAISNLTHAESYSLFGHIEAPISKVKISVGARQVWEEKDYAFYHLFLPVEQVLVDGREEAKFDAITPNLDLSFLPWEEQMWFVKAGRGFKSGGFNGRPLTAGGVQAFRPESLWSYEIGSKTRFDSGFLHASWFYSVYEDQQITGVTADDSGALLIVVENAEKSIIHGFEIEAQNRWATGWTVGLQLGTMDHTYKAFTTFDGEDLSYLKAPFSPDWNAALQITKAQNIWSGRLKSTFSIATKDDMELEIFNSRFLRQERFSSVHLNFVYEKGSWQFSFTGKNLSDEKIKIGGTTSEASLGVAGVLWDEPRTYLLSGKYAFSGGR